MKEGKAVEQSKKDVKGEEQRHQAMAEKKQEGDAERRKAGKEEACRHAKAAEAEAARRAEDEVLASLLPALSPALVSSSTSGAGAVTGAELDKAQQERARAPLPHLRASHRRHRQAPVSRRGMGGPRQ